MKKLELVNITNMYGEPLQVAMNDEYILRPLFTIGWMLEPMENYLKQFSDMNKVLRFRNADGFNTIQDCLDYIEKYFK